MEIDDTEDSASYSEVTPRDTPDLDDPMEGVSTSRKAGANPRQELLKQQKMSLATKRQHLADSQVWHSEYGMHAMRYLGTRQSTKGSVFVGLDGTVSAFHRG